MDILNALRQPLPDLGKRLPQRHEPRMVQGPRSEITTTLTHESQPLSDGHKNQKRPHDHLVEALPVY